MVTIGSRSKRVQYSQLFRICERQKRHLFYLDLSLFTWTFLFCVHVLELVVCELTRYIIKQNLKT